jgi:Rrf2 family protein
MPLLSTKGRYAARIMVALADHGDKRPMRSSEIACCESLTSAYTEQLLIKLKSAGLVHSVRGRSGGFVLACAPENTSLLTVLRAVEGDVCVTACAQQTSVTSCPRGTTCPTRALWAQADEGLRKVLGGATLASLARRGATDTAPTYDI